VATILAHITVKPGAEARFEEISRDLYRASHAGEQGLLRYEYWRGSEPSTYYTLLAFTDFAAFIAHQTSEHHEAVVAPTGLGVGRSPPGMGRPDAGREPVAEHRSPGPLRIHRRTDARVRQTLRRPSRALVGRTSLKPDTHLTKGTPT